MSIEVVYSSYDALKPVIVTAENISAPSPGSERLMTDPNLLSHDIAAVESQLGPMSRRRLLAAGLGAAAGLVAIERVVAALPNVGITTAAGPLQSS